MAESVRNVVVEVYSITGALVATFFNNTESADDLAVRCSEKFTGGLDSFSFTVPSDTWQVWWICLYFEGSASSLSIAARVD